MIKDWIATRQDHHEVAYNDHIFILIAWVSGVVVWFNQQIGVWFVLLALLTWVFRFFVTKSFIHKGPINIPVAIFLLTAMVGAWAAYDQQAAFHKFLILVAGIIIYFAMSGSNPNARSWSYGLISITAALLAVYFLLSHNWNSQPADFEIVNRIGLSWMKNRVDLRTIFDNANIPAGILAVLLPIIMIYIWQANTNKHSIERAIGLISLLLVGLALFMSSSRAVWFSLSVGLGVWGWWVLSKKAPDNQKWTSKQLFLSGVVLAIAIGIFLMISFSTQIFILLQAMPGAASADSRAGLFSNAIDLVPDYWLIGGGLQSFAGLYSQYILDIPFLYFRYAHNLYLDLIIEQGLLALLSFIAIFGLTIFYLMRGILDPAMSGAQQNLYLGLLAAAIVLLGHGLLDDALYGIRGTPFVFVIPGLVTGQAFAPSNELAHAQGLTTTTNVRSKASAWIVPVLVLLFGISLFVIPNIRAAAQANLGAVEMAKLELTNYPCENWIEGRSMNSLMCSSNQFQAALANNPRQRTANHRMGLIAMDRGDYSSAIKYLETAHQVDPTHLGIRKELGYAYVWSGDFESAYPLISNLPEAASEMEGYRWWWNQQGNISLAANADHMLNYLQSSKQ